MRFEFANNEEVAKFVNWIIEQDDIPYAAIPSIATNEVIMIHTDKLQPNLSLP